MDYELIDVARQKRKGGIIAKIIGAGNVDSGVGSNGEWKKQLVTLQDKSGTQDLVLWGDDIGKLDQGQYYKIENPFWSTYKDKVQLSLGKYAKLHLADQADLLDGGHVPAENHAAEQSTLTDKLPKISDTLKDFVITEDNLFLQIEHVIEDNHKLHGILINGQKIGLHAKEIYREAKKNKFNQS